MPNYLLQNELKKLSDDIRQEIIKKYAKDLVEIIEQFNQIEEFKIRELLEFLMLPLEILQAADFNIAGFMHVIDQSKNTFLPIVNMLEIQSKTSGVHRNALYLYNLWALKINEISNTINDKYEFGLIKINREIAYRHEEQHQQKIQSQLDDIEKLLDNV